MAYKLTGQLQSTGKLRTQPIYFFFVAHKHTSLLTLPDHSMPPIATEADAIYLPSCKLHSRSLTVGHTATGTCDLKIAYTWFTQS